MVTNCLTNVVKVKVNWKVFRDFLKMAEFDVRVTGNRNMVRFVGGDEDPNNILKPEEIGRAIISEPIDFEYVPVPANGVWPRFGTILKGLVCQAQERESLGLALEEKMGKDQYRIVICSDTPVKPEASKNDEILVNKTMKLRLVSNISLESSRQQREQGCLVQLAYLCGPQNVNFEVKGLGSAIMFPWIQNPCTLVWNQEDLCWEAEAEVTFQNKQLGKFGNEINGDRQLSTMVTMITSKIEDEGIKNVLRAMYTGPGNNWMLQKQLLEGGTFSDLVVISGNPKNVEDSRLFYCHRVKLAEASQVFCDMLQGTWEESQSRTIKLPESEDVIEAMLHFIYYGGTDRIYCSSADLVLELLQAGHKYDIPNLVDVSAFVISKGDWNGPWLTVEQALEIFSFARNVQGQLWTELREECYFRVWKLGEDERNKSKAWGKLFHIAKKLGKGYAYLFKHLHPEGKYGRKYLPGRIDGVKRVKMKEVELVYDFLMSEHDHVTCDSAVAMFFLAEYLNRPVKEVEQKIKRGIRMNLNWPVKYYRVDYLVELFCLARQKEGEFWTKLKMKAVRKLKECQTEKTQKMEESLKYKEMIQEDKEALKEFLGVGVALQFWNDEEEEEEDVCPGCGYVHD